MNKIRPSCTYWFLTPLEALLEIPIPVLIAHLWQVFFRARKSGRWRVGTIWRYWWKPLFIAFPHHFICPQTGWFHIMLTWFDRCIISKIFSHFWLHISFFLSPPVFNQSSPWRLINVRPRYWKFQRFDSLANILQSLNLMRCKHKLHH